MVIEIMFGTKMANPYLLQSQDPEPSSGLKVKDSRGIAQDDLFWIPSYVGMTVRARMTTVEMEGHII